MNVNPSILFVDDENEVLHALERCLRHSDADIMTAKNAEEAMDLMASTEISPSVSRARKSVRITFTTLRPPAASDPSR